MEAQELKSYVNYNLWANKRVVQLLRSCTTEQLEQTVVNSFPSIIETAAHIWDAEYLWLKRLEGYSEKDFPSKHFKGTSLDILDKLITISQDMVNYVQDKSEAYLFSKQEFNTTKGIHYSFPYYQMIHHCMNHSSYHRGQLITLCRQIGITEFESVDYITYLRLLSSEKET